MSTDFLPFFLIPLLLYTYFWVNPTVFAAFMEGLARFVAELYLGYKAWRLELETKRSFRYYQKLSRKMARENGFSGNLLKAYFEAYGEHDWKEIYQREKEIFEERNRDIEEQIRDNLLF